MLSVDEIRRLELERIKAFEAKQKRLMKRLIIGGAALFVVAFAIWAIAGFPRSVSEPSCTERGVAYYKEIGSYPKLSDGRFADVVISEMCANAPNTAFKTLNQIEKDRQR